MTGFFIKKDEPEDGWGAAGATYEGFSIDLFKGKKRWSLSHVIQNDFIRQITPFATFSSEEKAKCFEEFLKDVAKATESRSLPGQPS